MSWLDGITHSVGMILSTLLEIVKSREAWHATVHAVAVRHGLETEQQHSCFEFSDGSVVKNLPATAGVSRAAGLIPGSERSPVGGNGTRSSIPD